MTQPLPYDGPSDEQRLVQFIADHIKTRHTVVTSGSRYLACETCNTVVPAPDAARTLHENLVTG